MALSVTMKLDKSNSLNFWCDGAMSPARMLNAVMSHCIPSAAYLTRL